MTDPRTYLFVPATRLERVGKAWASGCDAVIVDLEDAVADADKDAARDAVATTTFERPVLVRVNARGTPPHEADLATVAGLGALAGVVLPMVESFDDVVAVRAALPASAGVIALVETPRGLQRIDDIVAGPVTRVAFGSTDYCSALGVERSVNALAHPRAVLAVAAAAAGLPTPVDGPYLGLDDDDGLRRDVDDARALGLRAKLCIHPRQVPVVRDVLRPSEEDVRRAEALLGAAATAGGGAFRWEGMMVDEPVLAAARAVLADAGPGGDEA